jgi:cytochrome c556
MARLPRLACAAGALFAVCLVDAAARADALDAIKARIELMHADSKAARLGADMIKGNAPFDLAKAKGVFATFVDAAQKEPALFPDDSKSGDGTTASPRIWEEMTAFKAAYAKFGEESAQAEKSITDLASFKAAFGTVTRNCSTCHERYRVKKG